MNKLSVECFLLVARTLSFSDSAVMLGITQQAVSRNIAKLEEFLDVQLILRSYHTVYLTDAGKKYLKIFEEFQRDLRQSSKLFIVEPPLARLHIAWCDWSGCPDFVLGWIREYQATQPKLNIIMTESDPKALLESFQSFDVDVVISSRYLIRMIDSSVYVTTLLLGELPLYIASSKTHPILSSCISPALLSNISIITSPTVEKSEADVQQRERLQYMDISFSAHNIQVLKNQSTVNSGVLWGNGITLSPARPCFSDHCVLQPTPKTVSLCASRLQRNQNPYAIELGEFFMGKIGRSA